VDTAASESLGSSSTAWIMALPSLVATTAASDTPSTLVASSTRAAAGSSAITIVGEPEPPAKCRDRTSWPRPESTSVRNRSDCVVPLALSCGRNAAPASSTSVVTIQTTRGRAPTVRATRPHRPVCSGAADPYVGRNGQNAARPSNASTAGRNVSDASSAPAIPIAATGPRPWLELSSENRRHSSPRMTVPADAVIGATVARHAALTAVYRSSMSRRISRNRATSSNA
jgi:hypothetical protein